ncbi:hypothetical protein SLEP1_g8220 [Rubroshorea leprosula]|nr:hypothetical protein SLEP1_g8220 [Rubroshorea leprosula]
MAGSGCENAEKVEQVLLQVHGDADAAIEFLVAERETEEGAVENDSLSCNTNAYDDDVNERSGKHKEEPVREKSKDDLFSNSTEGASDSRPDAKKISRNKVCPCGSKKKYKACCGAVSGRSSVKFLMYTT